MGDPEKTSEKKKGKKKSSRRSKATDSFVDAVVRTADVEEDEVCSVIYEAHTRALPLGQRGLAAAKENAFVGNVLAATETYGHGHHAYEMVRHAYRGVQWLTKGVFGR